MKDRIAVITRLHYPKHSPKFTPRLETYMNYTLPSLLAQTDGDFDIWVWCQPHHDQIIKSLSTRINTMHGNWEPRANTGRYFINYTPYSTISGFPKYTTQLGIDSDDELAPTAIESIRPYLTKRRAVSLQPIKRDVKTGTLYEMKDYEEVNKLSPIFAIHQPDEPYIFMYEYGHYSKMPEQFPDKVYLHDLAIMNIHKQNESTRLGAEGNKKL